MTKLFLPLVLAGVVFAADPPKPKPEAPAEKTVQLTDKEIDEIQLHLFKMQADAEMASKQIQELQQTPDFIKLQKDYEEHRTKAEEAVKQAKAAHNLPESAVFPAGLTATDDKSKFVFKIPVEPAKTEKK